MSRTGTLNKKKTNVQRLVSLHKHYTELKLHYRTMDQQEQKKVNSFLPRIVTVSLLLSLLISVDHDSTWTILGMIFLH